ncbi:MAG: PAS domain-containing protein [Candidatus Marinimicrobia bacterium]|nr:PAS domain-containing protein [Candidatus Neomarinimicrobiota bacterium]
MNAPEHDPWLTDAVGTVCQGVATVSGFSFFHALVHSLGQATQADYVLLTIADRKVTGQERVLALFDAKGVSEPRRLGVLLDPAWRAEPGAPLCLGAGTRTVFAHEALFKTWAIESLVSIALVGVENQYLGSLVALDRRPREDPERRRQLIERFAARAAVEIERERATEALWESEERYRSLTDDVLNASSLGTLVVDAGQRVVWVNKAFEQFFLMPRAALTGQTLSFVIEGMAPSILHGATYIERFTRAQREGFLLDKELIRVRPGADQAVRWIEHWSQPIRGGLYAGGRIEHFADITKRQEAQKERDRLAMAVEQSNEAILIADSDGRIVYANPATASVFGMAPAEALGRTLAELRGNRTDPGILREMTRAGAAGEIWQGLLQTEVHEGARLRAKTTASPLRDAAGAVQYIVIIARDVTREAELEAQFFQAQKMESLGRLAGGIVHDFGNLLTSIFGFSRLILDGLPADSPLRDDVQEIIGAGERAANLTRQLLMMSRKQTSKVSAVLLNDVIRDVQRLLERTMGEDLTLCIELAAELPAIEADAGLLEQVLMNLAVNARDAMASGGRLTLRTAFVSWTADDSQRPLNLSPGDYVCLTVADTGCGMSAEVRQHVFEPFYTTKSGDQGTGLGLSTVYGIVRQFNGWIELTSQPNAGCTFMIYFPVKPAEAMESPAGAAPPARERGRKAGGPPALCHETILLVEDDLTVRLLATRLLENAGYKVIEAADARQALDSVRRMTTWPALFIVDVILPQMDGPELIKRLRRRQPAIKVLYISGFSEERLTRRGRRTLDAPLLKKPFTGHTLSQAVRAVLGA